LITGESITSTGALDEEQSLIVRGGSSDTVFKSDVFVVGDLLELLAIGSLSLLEFAHTGGLLATRVIFADSVLQKGVEGLELGLIILNIVNNLESVVGVSKVASDSFEDDKLHIIVIKAVQNLVDIAVINSKVLHGSLDSLELQSLSFQLLDILNELVQLGWSDVLIVIITDRVKASWLVALVGTLGET